MVTPPLRSSRRPRLTPRTRGRGWCGSTRSSSARGPCDRRSRRTPARRSNGSSRSHGREPWARPPLLGREERERHEEQRRGECGQERERLEEDEGEHGTFYLV